MIGKQLNTLCKAIQQFTDEVYADEVIRVIDPAHVSTLEVSSAPGQKPSAPFGFINEHAIDVESVLCMKIGDKEELLPFVNWERGRFMYSSPETTYEFKMKDVDYKRPDIKIEFSNHFEAIDQKKFADIVKQAKNISDHIVLRSDEKGDLWIEAQDGDDGIHFKKNLGGTSGTPNLVSRYPIDYLINILKIVDGAVTVSFDNDHVIELKWSDEWFNYKAMIAPRIEAN